MKKKVFLTILAFLLALAPEMTAQTGYNYEGSFINFTRDTTTRILLHVDTLHMSKQQSQSLKKSVEGRQAIQVSDDCFFVEPCHAMATLGKYKSWAYQGMGRDTFYVLPKIIISLHAEVPISSITEQFPLAYVIGKVENIYKLACNVENSEQVWKLVKDISDVDGVEWCEPDMLGGFHLANELYPLQYYLKSTGQNGGVPGIDINVEPAWNITEGGSNIVVAVVDEGVEHNHEDLGHRVLPGFTVGNPQGLGEPMPENDGASRGHGTACAGIIAAEDNDIGIKGVACKVKLLPINIVPFSKYGTHKGFGSDDQIADAIRFAYSKADIMSCSWVCKPSNVISSAIKDALERGRDGKGTIVVAAAGNGYFGEERIAFPANIEGVISVGAVDKKGLICYYSQRGEALDLVAPSGTGDIVTTDRMGSAGVSPGNYTYSFSGTSAACPQVAGVAALILSKRPYLTRKQVQDVLRNSARDLGANGRDNTYGYGLVDAYAAVAAAMNISPIINGPSNFCSTEEFSLIGIPASASVYWRTSNGVLNIVEGQGTTTVVLEKVASGSCVLYADVPLADGEVVTASKNIFVGEAPVGMGLLFSNGGGSGFWDYRRADNVFDIVNFDRDIYPHLEAELYYLGKGPGNDVLVGQYSMVWPKSTTFPISREGFYRLQVRGVNSCGKSPWLRGIVNADGGTGHMFTAKYDKGEESVTITIPQAGVLLKGQVCKDAEYQCNIKVFNETMSRFKEVEADKLPVTISLQGWENGLYFVTVTDGSQSYTCKFLKNS